MPTKWKNKVPTKAGWYWVKYRNALGKDAVSPAKLTLKPWVGLWVAPGDKFILEGEDWSAQSPLYHHTAHGRLPHFIEFGPRIKEPE